MLTRGSAVTEVVVNTVDEPGRRPRDPDARTVRALLDVVTKRLAAAT